MRTEWQARKPIFLPTEVPIGPRLPPIVIDWDSSVLPSDKGDDRDNQWQSSLGEWDVGAKLGLSHVFGVLYSDEADGIKLGS